MLTLNTMPPRTSLDYAGRQYLTGSPISEWNERSVSRAISLARSDISITLTLAETTLSSRSLRFSRSVLVNSTSASATTSFNVRYSRLPDK